MRFPAVAFRAAPEKAQIWRESEERIWMEIGSVCWVEGGFWMLRTRNWML